MPEFDAIGLIQWRVRAEDEEQAKEILMDAMLSLEASFQASKSNPEGLEFRESDISVLEPMKQSISILTSGGVPTPDLEQQLKGIAVAGMYRAAGQPIPGGF